MLVDAKNVTVHIGEPETVKGKGLKQSYTVYTITTLPYNWVVRRRYSDFEWFLKCLEKRFPAHYVSLNGNSFQIPELPPKSLQKTNPDNVQLRLHSFSKFLDVILSSSELTYSPELIPFLSYDDVAFAKSQKVFFLVVCNF